MSDLFDIATPPTPPKPDKGNVSVPLCCPLRNTDSGMVTPRATEPRLCAIEGCKKPSRRLGMCHAHYMRAYRARQSAPNKPALAHRPKSNTAPRPRPPALIADADKGPKIIEWIEANLRQAERPDKAVVLDEWQRAFIIEAYRCDAGRRVHDTAILSVGRKNGKSTLCAAVALAELCAPGLARPGDILTGSTDRAAAGVLIEQAARMARHSGLMSELRAVPSRKILEHKETGGRWFALSSDAANAVSYIPRGIFIDELGYHKNRALFDALDTSRGALNPLLVIIGTRGAPGSVLNRIIEGQEKTPSPATLLRVYSAPDDADPFAPDTWRQANPGLGTIRDDVELARFAAASKTDNERLAAFKTFYLNQSAEAGVEQILSVAEWRRCDGEAKAEGVAFAGLDLSEGRDPTALALFWPDTGRIETHAFIPAHPSPAERAAKEGLPYPDLMDAGRVHVAGDVALDYLLLAERIADLVAGHRVALIAADPWRLRSFEASATTAGITMPRIKPFKQGYAMMSAAINCFERMVLAGDLKHGGDLLLQRALANAKVVRDGKHGRMYSKIKSSGRIDPLVAATMAVGSYDNFRADPQYQLVQAIKRGEQVVHSF